jgi:hypothetical protein
VIEKVNILISANGTVIKSEIEGAIHVKSCLSGMPELRLGLNDKLQLMAGDRQKYAKLLLFCWFVFCCSVLFVCLFVCSFVRLFGCLLACLSFSSF